MPHCNPASPSPGKAEEERLKYAKFPNLATALINEYLNDFSHVHQASAKYFAESGKITGSFYTTIKEMLKVHEETIIADYSAQRSIKWPSVEDAGVIAVGLSEHLNAQEQSFFIAGFQECIKYLTLMREGVNKK